MANSEWLMAIACYLLPVTYYLLPITYYLLPTTYYRSHDERVEKVAQSARYERRTKIPGVKGLA